MNIVGMLRVKNEARWIERCISSILPLCEQVLVFDDHSTDDTAAICAAMPNVAVVESPFEGLDEARDKNHLLQWALTLDPEWIIAIDGDEMLQPGQETRLLEEMELSRIGCLSLRVLYLWDSENQVRVDGVYGDFHRESVFRPNGSTFMGNSNGGNFHCGNVPWGARQKRHVTSIPLLHFGYMHREDRERKFAWYNQQDPENLREDCYRHMVIGDRFPAESKFMHAGPLQLKAI